MRAGTRVVLDIDYRPVLWGLRPPATGRAPLRRSPTRSARTLHEFLPRCDLIVGTEEEFAIAGGTQPTRIEAIDAVREMRRARLWW